jgi:hypothetical protein
MLMYLFFGRELTQDSHLAANPHQDDNLLLTQHHKKVVEALMKQSFSQDIDQSTIEARNLI